MRVAGDAPAPPRRASDLAEENAADDDGQVHRFVADIIKAALNGREVAKAKAPHR